MLFKMTRPYVGVSEFLKGQRNREGKLYFPEFDPGEYWSRRYLDWDKGNFTDDEIELFFDGDSSRAIAIPALDHETWRDANGKIKDEDNFGSDDEKKLRKMMEEKWSAQAEEGTAIHDVLQRFFSQTNNSRGGNPVYWYDLLTDENTSIRALHETRFVSLMKAKTGLKEEHIKEVLDYARELKTEIQARYGKGCTFYPEITLSAKLNKTFEGRDDLEILGRLDLLVVDENGYPQIIDYKTSPRPYDKYSSSKKLGFTY
jgi:ATP-dependent exoDNAse (exonuclease V) beta subunit